MQCLLHVKKNLHLYARNFDGHGYGTRYGERLLPAFSRTGRARDGVNYYCAKLFNALPTCVQDMPLNAYKSVIKMYLLKNAFYSMDEYLSATWDIVA